MEPKRLKVLEELRRGDVGGVVDFCHMKPIQVKWLISSSSVAVGEDDLLEEEQDDEYVWWDAVVMGRTGKDYLLERDEEGEEEDEEDEEEEGGVLLPVYEIRYSARPPAFPHPEVASVVVLDEHYLVDVVSGSELAWRHLGSSWDPEEEKDGQGENKRETLVDFFLKSFANLEEEEILRVEEGDGGSTEQCNQAARGLVESIIKDLAQKYDKELASLGSDRQFTILERVGDMRERLVGQIALVLKSTGRFTMQDLSQLVSKLK
ncbi:hypothetical protein BASA81_008004 [Batrachochytrium salamandrivorans]|nr:hypothetical protein BASA81_008004 [Batrachochytrium salamandrivorans]